jgi:hypothetical protein
MDPLVGNNSLPLIVPNRSQEFTGPLQYYEMVLE